MNIFQTINKYICYIFRMINIYIYIGIFQFIKYISLKPEDYNTKWRASYRTKAEVLAFAD